MTTKTTQRSVLMVSGLLFISVFFMGGCKKETTPQAVQVDSYISGVVTTPSGERVGAAEVLAGAYSTLTRADGSFKLAVPKGDYTLVIRTGSGHLFKTTLTVKVEEKEELVIPMPSTILKQVGALAYIPGRWDRIQDIIIDSLGYSATQLSFTDLNSLATLSQYQALFLNCGVIEYTVGGHMDSLKYTNLLTFLQQHGSIYASDYAVKCLTGDGYWRPAPGVTYNHDDASRGNYAGCIGKNGGFFPDSALCTATLGTSQIVYDADVVDQSVIAALGDSTMDIDYDLGAWMMVTGYAVPMHPVITSPVLGPLALRSDIFADEYGGQLFYTTFHNEPTGQLTPDMKVLLNYFILHL